MPPSIRKDRRELGFSTTECACANCVSNCRERPGFLIPTDVNRMWKTIAPHMILLEFATAYLEVGKGGTTMNEDGRFIKTQTLRPKIKPGGCIFLRQSRCTIHDISPYGCCAYDCSMGAIIGNERSMAGLQAIFTDIYNGGVYFQVLEKLMGLKKFQMIEDITDKLFPEGVPQHYLDIAAALKESKHASLRRKT